MFGSTDEGATAAGLARRNQQPREKEQGGPLDTRQSSLSRLAILANQRIRSGCPAQECSLDTAPATPVTADQQLL